MLSQKLVRKIGRSLALPLVISAVCFLLARFLFARVPILNGLELQDKVRASRMRPATPANPQVVVITFDESEGAKLGLGPDRRRPRREDQAELLSLLDAAGAKAALVDVEFSSETRDDGSLPKALHSLKSLKVTLADGPADKASMDGSKVPPAGRFDTVAIWNDRTSDKVRLGSIWDVQAAATKDYIGGYPKQFDETSGQGILYAPISVAMQAKDVSAQEPQVLEPNFFAAGPLEWELDSNGAIEGRWLPTAEPFTSRDFADAIQILRDPSRRSLFRDKIVLIGDVESDKCQVPGLGMIPGVDFLAQMVNTALLKHDAQFSGASEPPYIAYCLLMGSLAFVAVRPRRPLATVAILAGLVAICWLSQLWYARQDGFWPAVAPTFIVCMCALVGTLAGRYWSDSLDFAAGPGEVATVLFLDLRGSTKLLNEIGVDPYRKVLGTLFDLYGKHLKRFGGRIERNTGDGFIAVFRENGSKSHALRCADCCEGLIAITREVGDRLNIPLAIALGFEAGMVSGDYIEESGRRVWSSSGATVHLAQRLQSLCAELGIEIAIGPVARRLISGHRPCELVTHAVVKGFDEPVEISTFARSSDPDQPQEMQ